MDRESVKVKVLVASFVSDSLPPHGLYSPPGSSVRGILQARRSGLPLEKASVTFSSKWKWDPRMAFPQPLLGEREGEAGVAQIQLTWGATIVQSLANSTCPERAKMMTLRKEVNHITHSKSATSWGRSQQVKVGLG